VLSTATVLMIFIGRPSFDHLAAIHLLEVDRVKSNDCRK